MRLIKLTRQDGSLVWVNPDFVVEVREMPAPSGVEVERRAVSTIVVLSVGTQELVQGEVAEVAQLIEAQAV
jgi:uncharacterized protein YlzI (FlbEa/FlbD family)